MTEELNTEKLNNSLVGERARINTEHPEFRELIKKVTQQVADIQSVKIIDYNVGYHTDLKEMRIHLIIMNGEHWHLHSCFPWGHSIVTVMVKYEMSAPAEALPSS